jgi:hypothetical protein
LVAILFLDPQAQEAVLSSYATKGIITINEARAALGRDPFLEAAANTPMVLTASGYVALGAGGRGEGDILVARKRAR